MPMMAAVAESEEKNSLKFSVQALAKNLSVFSHSSNVLVAVEIELSLQVPSGKSLLGSCAHHLTGSRELEPTDIRHRSTLQGSVGLTDMFANFYLPSFILVRRAGHAISHLRRVSRAMRCE